MSTPEHTPATAPIAHPESSAEVEGRRARDAQIYENATNPTHTTRAVSWVGWHVGELAGVLFPLGLGATVWDGCYVASVLTALGWAANEVRLRRQQHTPRTRNGGEDRAQRANQNGEVSA
jgi:hypothetical protein